MRPDKLSPCKQMPYATHKPISVQGTHLYMGENSVSNIKTTASISSKQIAEKETFWVLTHMQDIQSCLEQIWY